MPDLARERRDRARQSLDQRVVFGITVEGVNDFGEPTENVVEWTGWGRREDADIDSTYGLGEGGVRDFGEVRLITRYDDRIRVGPRNTFEVAGETFHVTLVEEVGRRRYMRLVGMRAS